MSHNLVVSYDLYKSGQNYDALHAAIHRLGGAVKVHLSVWFVSSPYPPLEAATKLLQVMDGNDKLWVVDALTNTWAYSKNTDATTVANLNKLWSARPGQL